ncbi:MAG: crotonobetainyl-CoA:carnitine CoA-transferase CaiB-like acyl-CoA transferase [Myxococcota bacterium]|jgi:crotonobetainyl-CoA:carnitine CoA-transferase CaiB-like acyl-CoA transferase
MLNLPVTFSRSPSEITSTAPEFGPHTEEVLVEELGYT